MSEPAPRPDRRTRGAVVAAGLVALAGAGVACGPDDAAPPAAPAAVATPVDTWAARAEDDARGAAPLGSRVPPPPEDALHVAPGGSGEGSPEDPLGSIAQAVRQARSGATIVLRAGTYHEEVGIFARPGDPRSDLTIQAYPGEEVWLDGSREAQVEHRGGRAVIRWRDSEKWNDWQGFDDRDETGDLEVVGEQNPVAADATEVWVAGERLWQVERDPGPGEFCVERGGRRDARTGNEALIVLGADPGAAQVRVGALAQAITADVDGLTLSGFGVRGYATPVNWMGTVYLEGRRPHVSDVVFHELPAIPLFLSGATGAIVEHVTVTDAGLQGISAVHTDGAMFSRNEITGANFQRFNPAPIAGGMKVGQMAGFVIEDSAISRTHGASGLWVDESGVDFTLAGNLVADSGYSGVVVEISGRGLVTGNTIVRSGEAGITVYGSQDVSVAHNLVADSGSDGGQAATIAVLQDGRRAADGGMGVDSRGGESDLTWVTSGVRVEGNVLALPDPAATAHVLAMDYTGRVSADDMGISLTGNVFVESVPTSAGASGVPTLAWRSDEDLVLAEPQDAARHLGGSWSRNVMIPAESDPRAMDVALDEAAREAAPPVGEEAADALGMHPGTELVGPPARALR